jgi:ribosomal protein S6E (S10)
MKVRSNSGEMSTKGGARYKPKRKTIRRKKGIRGQKITKNKRKLKRKQY